MFIFLKVSLTGDADRLKSSVGGKYSIFRFVEEKGE
jgi:hypothetical protein